jgi:hypothetical protein
MALEMAKRELEEFVESRVWKRLIADALEESGANQQLLESSDPLTQATVMSRAQGFLHGLTWFVDHPAVLLEEIDYTRKTEKKTEEEKEDGDRR